MAGNEVKAVHRHDSGSFASGRGRLMGFMVNHDTGATGQAIVYDNASAASGTIIIEIDGGVTSTLADGESEIEFNGTVYDQFENPMADVTVSLVKDGYGTLSKTTAKTDANGEFTFSLTSPASNTNKSASVYAEISSLSSNIIDVSFKGIEIDIEIDRASLPANGMKKGYITAQVLETVSRNAVDDGDVYFSSTSGAITTSSALDANGYSNAVFTSGSESGTVVIKAIYGTLSDSISITLYESIPGNISLTSQDSILSLEEPNIGTDVDVFITDSYGDTVINNTQVLLITKLGIFSNGSNSINLYSFNGGASTKLYPDADNGTGIDTVAAISGSIEVYKELVTVSSSTVDTVLIGTGNAVTTEGVSTIQITAVVKDEYGHPIADGVVVNFSIESGNASVYPTVTETAGGKAYCKIEYSAADAGQNITLKIVTGSKIFYKTITLP